MSKNPRKTAVKSISMPPEILKAGISKARSMGRTFSSHVQWLIQRDLREGGVK